MAGYTPYEGVEAAMKNLAGNINDLPISDWEETFGTVIYQYLEGHFEETSVRFRMTASRDVGWGTDHLALGKYEEWLTRIFLPFWASLNHHPEPVILKNLIERTLPRFLAARQAKNRLLS